MTEEFSHNQTGLPIAGHGGAGLAAECPSRLTGDVAGSDPTVVPPESGGRGIAGRLVTHAMDEVRTAGAWKVRPACSYVAGWFGKHPEYADLLA